VWSVAGLVDESGFVSASADKTVKFWEYELETEADGTRQLMIRHTRTLQVSEHEGYYFFNLHVEA
jgi:U3 small nucleolar RNA-associated protein 12